jgi:hypothetical protein
VWPAAALTQRSNRDAAVSGGVGVSGWHSDINAAPKNRSIACVGNICHGEKMLHRESVYATCCRSAPNWQRIRLAFDSVVSEGAVALGWCNPVWSFDDGRRPLTSTISGAVFRVVSAT